MFGFSTIDGFVVINENLGDMIKYVANEPSVGMYFIQQHAQNAVPNLIKLKTNVINKSKEATLHTEDLEESISITRSMKECGIPIIDEMIREIKASLTIVKEGMIQKQSLGYEVSGPGFWVPVTWARSIVGAQNDGEGQGGGTYFSNVFKSSKGEGSGICVEKDEGDKLRLCSHVEDEVLLDDSNVFIASNQYDEFKADREAKLEDWLKGSSCAIEKETGDTEEQLPDLKGRN